MARAIPRSRVAPLLVLALWVAACTKPVAPLTMQVIDSAALAAGEWGATPVLIVTVTFTNRGDAPLHVLHDTVAVTAADGARGELRAFRDAFRRLAVTAASPQALQHALQPLARAGLDRGALEALRADVTEVLPGATLRRTLPVVLAAQTGSMTLQLRYHDDATDQMLTASARFAAHPAAAGQPER